MHLWFLQNKKDKKSIFICKEMITLGGNVFNQNNTVKGDIIIGCFLLVRITLVW